MRTASKAIQGGAPGRFRFKPRPYLMVYHQGEKNRCPGCGRSSWNVGRTTAQCSFCDSALEIVTDGTADQRNFEQ